MGLIQRCTATGALALAQSMNARDADKPKVVHRKDIDYTNLWPIALAPVIPAVGIALRCEICASTEKTPA